MQKPLRELLEQFIHNHPQLEITQMPLPGEGTDSGTPETKIQWYERNTPLRGAAAWMALRSFTLSESSQSQRL